jgi:DNA-directed RNA polymerase specialized sigma24 family protein
MSNETVIGSARNGDPQAFAKLVQEYYRPIYGLAFSAVGNWQAAEDVAQDTFLVARRSRATSTPFALACLQRNLRLQACMW